ncbi:unnamed protein product [Hydatigera taeniaeformis]|uniref:Cysteine protease n=1 Tax=Hydatigena taeniaeformis TaxID=6205 RepID=A0A0R3WMZ0_HYDTA|nr:unnamed protein product [Hydatigera taeniaeformis]
MRLSSVLDVRKIYPFGRSDSWFRKDQWLRFAFVSSLFGFKLRNFNSDTWYLQLFRGRTARCFRLAHVQVIKALMHVKTVRRTRRRDMYNLWNARIDRACKDHGLPSSESLVDIAKQYHLDVGCHVPHASPPSGPFVSRDVVDDDSGLGDLIRSVWNQVRFGWSFSLAPRLLSDHPANFLGKKYFDLSSSEVKRNANDEMKAFLTDFHSRLWFTYRASFPPLSTAHPIICLLDLPNGGLLNTTAALRAHLRGSVTDSSSSPTTTSKIPHSTRVSDCGWGCMLRSVQMMVAQALLLHFLGRDWIYKPHNGASTEEPTSRIHRRIIRWFADSPSSPLSIHRLVQASGSPPGTCFGPAAVCQSLLVAMACAEEAALKEVEVYLAHDRVICNEEVLALFDVTSPNLSEAGVQNSTYRDAQNRQSEVNGPPDYISDPSASLLGVLTGVSSASYLSSLTFLVTLSTAT